MFQAVREAFGFGKTTDPMQTVQHDPTPTVKEMDSVAAAFEKDATRWKEAALKADAGRIKALAERNAARAELARLKASRERSNANLRRGSAPKVKHPIHGVHSIA